MNSTYDQVRRDLVETAKSMIAGDLDLVRGFRRLNRLSRSIDPSNRSIFNPIIGFESETDDYPSDEARSKYEKAYLEKVDREILEYSDRARSSVLNSCRLIVAEYDA
jgi:hypothetical protein